MKKNTFFLMLVFPLVQSLYAGESDKKTGSKPASSISEEKTELQIVRDQLQEVSAKQKKLQIKTQVIQEIIEICTKEYVNKPDKLDLFIDNLTQCVLNKSVERKEIDMKKFRSSFIKCTDGIYKKLKDKPIAHFSAVSQELITQFALTSEKMYAPLEEEHAKLVLKLENLQRKRFAKIKP